LDLHHDGLVDDIDTGLPTGVIDAGECSAAHPMAAREAEHRPLIQHGVRGMRLAIGVMNEHDSSSAPPGVPPERPLRGLFRSGLSRESAAQDKPHGGASHHER
jgi:hypothetical protein